jgi:putative endonuclease
VSGSSKQWCVYIVRCNDNTLYTGCTNDISKRIADHNNGNGAKYTRNRIPVELMWSQSVDDKSAALKLEYKIKQLKRHQKTSLIESGCDYEG